ncbi:hypothetical protein ATANTOWER_025806, partial [Ataeniobius toweri]|nr:hypothetical protein [Ataeniobius toweri]
THSYIMSFRHSPHSKQLHLSHRQQGQEFRHSRALYPHLTLDPTPRLDQFTSKAVPSQQCTPGANGLHHAPTTTESHNITATATSAQAAQLHCHCSANFITSDYSSKKEYNPHTTHAAAPPRHLPTCCPNTPLPRHNSELSSTLLHLRQEFPSNLGRAANHPSACCTSWLEGPRRTTSAAKRRDEIQWSPTQTPSSHGCA